MKYINAEKLREKIYAEDTVSLAHGSLPEFDQGCHYAFLTILSFIDSLQQEQPEVDLAEEITRFFSKNAIPYEHLTDWPLLKNTALYFYELGLNAKNGN